MQKIEVRHTFDAPPQAVWDAYTDHARWKEWAGFPKSWLEVEGSPDRNGTGCVRGLGQGPMTVFEEVRDFEPPKRMTYTVVRGAVPFKNHLGEVVFEPEGDGTLVIWRCRFDSKVPGLGWLFQRYVSGIFRKALHGLERHSFSSQGS
jgi:uncharacterized protein YndB with AHSA1/START domain